MVSMDNSICGAITNNFQLPSFCECTAAPAGGSLTCEVGLGNIISIGANGFIYPCGSPASLGYKAWASLFGMSKVILPACLSVHMLTLRSVCRKDVVRYILNRNGHSRRQNRPSNGLS